MTKKKEITEKYNNSDSMEMKKKHQKIITEIKEHYENELNKCEEEKMKIDEDRSVDWVKCEEQTKIINKECKRIIKEREENIAIINYEIRRIEYEEIRRDHYFIDEKKDNDLLKNYTKAYHKKKKEYKLAKENYMDVKWKVVQKYDYVRSVYEKAKEEKNKKMTDEKKKRITKIKEEIKEEIENIRNKIGCDGIAFHDYAGGRFEKQNEISRFKPNDLEKGLPPPDIDSIRNCMKIEGHVLIDILETGFLNYIVYSHRSSKQHGLIKWIKLKYNPYYYWSILKKILKGEKVENPSKEGESKNPSNDDESKNPSNDDDEENETKKMHIKEESEVERKWEEQELSNLVKHELDILRERQKLMEPEQENIAPNYLQSEGWFEKKLHEITNS